MTKVLVSLEEALLRRIDRVARARGLTRSAYLAEIAQRDVSHALGPREDAGCPARSLPPRRARRLDRSRRVHRARPCRPRRTVREVVLDASVVLKWFRGAKERHVDEARALRAAYEAGELVVWAPPLLHLEILNVAGRRWQLDEDRLVTLAGALDDLGFELLEPPLEAIARWIARGLTAYDAAYSRSRRRHR